MSSIIIFIKQNKLVITVIISLAVGFFGGMEYKSYQIRRSFADFGEAVGSIFGGNRDSKAQNTGKATDNTNAVACPKITVSGSYEFDIDNDKRVSLSAAFLKNAIFDDGYELNNLPITEGYFSDSSFRCEPGTSVGQSVNKLYCQPISSFLFYQPKLRKNTVDDQGDIVKTDYLDIKEFIFDIIGKDITNVNQLKELKLESIGCEQGEA